MPGNQEFFDNPEVLARYLAHRDRPDNPNNTLERPIFLELAGNLSNLDIVDLGCGNADFGQQALLQGAHSCAFRIGQKKNVFVHKFVAIGTLEERIDQMIEDKKKLSSSVVGTDESWLTQLDNESFKQLISLNKAAILD
ncbi:hypothetical protein [Floridanema evergladense]|uniref:Methyltransferase domain-containing protein n=1 Tax=Floridaenema evergladense BLCC-F167 TaxID=3153639 RepID=A0ABV4WVH5_9CYAN